MDYDELINTLYRFARETEDEELQGWLLDVVFVVKKNGIQGLVDDPNINLDDGIYFADLINKLETMSDIARNNSDKIKIHNLKNTLILDGIDGLIK
ncbi:MAG: hypothetical protein ACLRHZ_16235 [Enterococcus avium]